MPGKAFPLNDSIVAPTVVPYSLSNEYASFGAEALESGVYPRL